jgi:hypothetical protein
MLFHAAAATPPLHLPCSAFNTEQLCCRPLCGHSCRRNCAGALTTAAALPAAAVERDTVSSDSDVSLSGSNGSTAQEPASSAEPSSDSAESQEEAATKAEEPAQPPAADASAAASATSAAGSNGAAAPAEAAAEGSGVGAASTKPQRRQKDRAVVARGQQRPQRREPQDRQPTGPVEPIPKVRATSFVCLAVQCSRGP